MAQRTVTRRVCDLDKSNPAHQVQLALGGTPCVLDLCNDHEEALLRALQPYLEVAQTTVVVPTLRKRPSPPARAVPALVREWANREGIEAPSRGRVSRELEDRYLAANR